MTNTPRLFCLLFILFSLLTGCSQHNIRYQSAVTPSGLKTVIWPTDNGEQDTVKTAELRLVIKTGSLDEQDDERGFAHFVEHLAFNNTEKYPKESLFRELEAFGLSFGAHSNAYTDFQSTVYKLTLKDVTDAKLDKALEILSQWAMHVQFDQKTVDAEKGVIREEWRLRQPQKQGWQARYIKALHKNSRYANRLPIGDLKVVESATAEKLEAFYKRWYQPQNSALIVTGAINSDTVRPLINKYFASWQKASPVKQDTYNIARDAQPDYLYLSDKKVDTNHLQFDYFIPASRPASKEAVYERQVWVAGLTLLNQRIRARLQETAGKVSQAGTSWHYPSPDVLSISVLAMMSGNGLEAGTRLLQEEVAYLLKHGVTEDELTAWKTKTLESNRTYKETAGKLAGLALRNVLYENPLQEQDEWLEMLERRLPKLDVATVSTAMRKLFSGQANTLVIHHPDTKVAGQQQLAQWVADSRVKGAARAVTVAQTGESDQWLINPQSKGQITAQRKIGELQEWTLSNGMKVYYRYSNHQPGKVWYQLSGVGGMNRLNPQKTLQARLALETIGASGLREMNGPQLAKWLSNQNMSLQPYYGFFDRGVAGRSGNKDFDTMMRLLHVSLTEGRVAPQAWQHNLENNRQQLKQLAKSRTRPWRTQTDRVLYNNDPAFRILTLAELDAITPEQLGQIYTQTFSGAQNYRMVIVGDLADEAARAAVLESIATLPARSAAGKQRAFPSLTRSDDIAVKGSGDRAAVLLYKMALPKAQIDSLGGGLDYKRMVYLRTWLNKVLLEELREKDGLVYSASASLDGVYSSMPDYTMTLQLACDPEKIGQVKQRIAEILQQMSANPPEQQRMLSWQKTRKSSIADSLQKPASLAASIMASELTGIPLDKLEDLAYRTSLPEAAQLAAALAQFNGSSAKKLWMSWLP